MFDELYQQQSKTAFKAYLLVIFAFILIIVPIKEFIQYFKYLSQFQQVMTRIQQGSVSQIPLQNVLALFQRTTYRGKWAESFKKSQIKQGQGLIQLRTFQNSDDGYTIKIFVYSGIFIDNGRYQVIIDSSSLLTKQFLQRGKIIYQTDTPFIAFQKHRNDSRDLFHEESQSSVFINKLKLKIMVIQQQQSQQSNKPLGIKVQLQMFSSFNINILTKPLQAYSQHYHQLFLSIILFFQCCLEINEEDNVGQDTLFQLLLQLQQVMEYKYYSSIIFVLLVRLNLLFLAYLHFFQLYNSFLYQDYKDRYFLFLLKIYGTIIVFYLTTYLFSLDGWLFTIYSCAILFPQIYRNYIVGHKLKIDLNKFLMFALPRYILIIYLRGYKYNIFNFQPNYLFTIMNLCLLFSQILLLLGQKKYGVRAIVPKFMHPSQFKYFMNQPHTQDLDCSICLISLKLKPQIQQMKKQKQQQSKHRLKQDIYNNVVLTPCRHKFHIQCLLKWMQSKLQCPNCRTLLPPLEDYQ